MAVSCKFEKALVTEPLRNIERWINWSVSGDDSRKMPSGRNGSAGWQKPESWMTFEEAVDRADRAGGHLGIGIVLSSRDDLICIDLDNAILDGGELEPWAADIVERFADVAWAEKSASGRGVHLFTRVAGGVRGRASVTAPGGRGKIERYGNDGRWMAITADCFGPGVIDDGAEPYQWLAETYFGGDAAVVAKPPAGDAGGGETHAEDVETARVALGLLSPSRSHDGEDWRKVGFALKSVDDDLLPDWLAFSSQWPDYSEKECRDRWGRMQPQEVGLGSLIWMATQDSGVPEREVRYRGWKAASRGDAWEGDDDENVCVPDLEIEDEAEVMAPFPLESLPTVLRDYVAAVSEAVGADPSMTALPLLSTIAGVIGNSATIEVKPGWLEPAVLWTMVVADSGSAKTPCFKAATGIVAEIEEELEAQREAAEIEWRKEQRIHKVDLAKWEAERKKLGEECGDPPEAPEEPATAQLVVGDATVEGVHKALKESPNGILLARDEMSGFVAGFDKYRSNGGGADAASWLECYGAGTIRVVRVKSGRTFIPRAAVSITGGIQPALLAKVTAGGENVDNGLLPRFVVARPEYQPIGWNSASVSAMARDPVVAIVKRIWEYATSVAEGADPEELACVVSEAGVGEFSAFVESMASEMAEATSGTRTVLSKAKAWAARAALVFHVVRQAKLGLPPTGSEVCVQDVRCGITFARWAAGEWQRVREESKQREPSALLDWLEIKRGGEWVTMNDVNCSGPSQFRRAAARNQEVERLLDAGLIERRKTKPEGGGRPATEIRLRPGV